MFAVSFLVAMIVFSGCLSESSENQQATVPSTNLKEMAPTTSTVRATTTLPYSPRLRDDGRPMQEVSTTSPTTTIRTYTTSSNSSDSGSELVNYSNIIYGFHVSHPGDWKKIENVMGIAVSFMSPPENAVDEFSENLNIAAAPYYKRMTLAEFKADTSENFQKVAEGYRQVEIGEITVNGNSGYRHIYTFNQGGVPLKGVQYVLYTKTYVYVLTCTAKASTYDKYQPTFVNMVNSFKPKD